MNGPRYRIAPSPTGIFHVGGARTALHNWALARRLGGVFVLRIEDTDEVRSQPEWTQGIVDALAWLGISSDDAHFEGPFFQSAYADQHVAAGHRLYESGHAYYCDLTGEQIHARSKELGVTGYDGYSRNRGLEPAPGRVLRFRVPDGHTIVSDEVRGDVDFDNATIEDFVLLRGTGSPMFLLANVVDDMTMGITNVLRAEEHLPNTPKQQMLWQALGHEPPVWAHVPVLVNEQRKKLSKRRDKVGLEQYRDEGYLPEAMVNYLMTLGWAPKGDAEIAPWSELEADFRIEDVNHSPAFFDVKKLNAFNADYIRALPVDQFVIACEPWLQRWRDQHPDAVWDQSRFQAMAPFVQLRVVTLADAAGVVDFMFLPEPVVDADGWAKTFAADGAGDLLAETTAAFSELATWSADELKATLESIAERRGLKLGKAQGPVRLAVTGRPAGPPLFEPLELIGRDEVLRRMHAAGTTVAAAG